MRSFPVVGAEKTPEVALHHVGSDVLPLNRNTLPYVRRESPVPTEPLASRLKCHAEHQISCTPVFT